MNTRWRKWSTYNTNIQSYYKYVRYNPHMSTQKVCGRKKYTSAVRSLRHNITNLKTLQKI